MPEPPFDVAQANRWFAIELNNLAWDWIERPSRTAEETERLIHAAHASCHHWLQVGAPLNHQRAQCLIATAYAAANLLEAALRHAERCLALSAEAGAEQTPFDLATAFGCAARAYAIAGRTERARQLHAKARSYVEQFDHPDDQVLFDKLYPAT
jgi:hypothetical protein